jgi:hypothetical protein
MDESGFRSWLHKALGESDLPPHVPVQSRAALRQEAAREPRNHPWIAGGVAALLAIAIVAGFLGVGTVRRTQSVVNIPSPSGPCPAWHLVVTGTKGERMHPAELPQGFVLQLGDEGDLGGIRLLEYTTPGNTDRPWVEIGRYMTTQPMATLLAGTHETTTVQGKPAVLSAGNPGGSDFLAVDWQESEGVVLFVTTYKIPRAEVLAIANHVVYTAGTEFTYPARPRVTITKQQALSALSGPTADRTAVLTSFGEADAVVQSPGTINHVPTLDPTIDVVRPVWVVWRSPQGATKLATGNGVVIDANTSQKLAVLSNISVASLLSLTDRSQVACVPPFGVLTRSEFVSVVPTIEGSTSSVKLMTLQMLKSASTTSSIGNCELAKCDPSVPVWVWMATASDCSLMFRCGPPFPGLGGPPRSTPTPPSPGSWALRAFDARTGPQNTELSGVPSGHGQLPSDLAVLPDLAPAP